MIPPEFLELEEVLEIHTLQLDAFGGIAGVRDTGLLESAVEQPRATAFGELRHADLFEMAEYQAPLSSGNSLSCGDEVRRRVAEAHPSRFHLPPHARKIKRRWREH